MFYTADCTGLLCQQGNVWYMVWWIILYILVFLHIQTSVTLRFNFFLLLIYNLRAFFCWPLTEKLQIPHYSLSSSPHLRLFYKWISVTLFICHFPFYFHCTPKLYCYFKESAWWFDFTTLNEIISKVQHNPDTTLKLSRKKCKSRLLCV